MEKYQECYLLINELEKLNLAELKCRLDSYLIDELGKLSLAEFEYRLHSSLDNESGSYLFETKTTKGNYFKKESSDSYCLKINNFKDAVFIDYLMSRFRGSFYELLFEYYGYQDIFMFTNDFLGSSYNEMESIIPNDFLYSEINPDCVILKIVFPKEYHFYNLEPKLQSKLRGAIIKNANRTIELSNEKYDKDFVSNKENETKIMSEVFTTRFKNSIEILDFHINKEHTVEIFNFYIIKFLEGYNINLSTTFVKTLYSKAESYLDSISFNFSDIETRKVLIYDYLLFKNVLKKRFKKNEFIENYEKKFRNYLNIYLGDVVQEIDTLDSISEKSFEKYKNILVELYFNCLYDDYLDRIQEILSKLENKGEYRLRKKINLLNAHHKKKIIKAHFRGRSDLDYEPFDYFYLEKYDSEKQEVWDFKNGKNHLRYVCRIAYFLKNKNLCLVPIPSSDQNNGEEKTFKRYYSFFKKLELLTGVDNIYNYFRVEYPYCGRGKFNGSRVEYKSLLKNNRSKFSKIHTNGLINLKKEILIKVCKQEILIFDDVLGRGDTFLDLKKMISKTSNKRVSGLFIATNREEEIGVIELK